MNVRIEKKYITVPASRFSWPGKIHRLARSECSAFFSADVSVLEKNVRLCFRTEGYRPLKEKQQMNAVQSLGILKELIQHLSDARDWMWYPETLVITMDTVWIGKNGSVRLLCIPDSQELALHRRLCLFAENLKSLTLESERDIISRVQKQWMDRPHPVHRILGGIDRMILDLQEYSSYRFIK